MNVPMTNRPMDQLNGPMNGPMDQMDDPAPPPPEPPPPEPPPPEPPPRRLEACSFILRPRAASVYLFTHVSIVHSLSNQKGPRVTRSFEGSVRPFTPPHLLCAALTRLCSRSSQRRQLIHYCRGTIGTRVVFRELFEVRHSVIMVRDIVEKKVE